MASTITESPAPSRIERDREAALRKYKQDRDTTALERTMKRLDDEEREAQAATQVISAEEAVAWLQDLPALWAAADDSGRRLLTEALFEKVEVLGVKSVTIHPTPEADAHGWSEAFGPTPQLIPVEMVAYAEGTDGRGERSRAYTFQISVTVLDGDGSSITSRSSDVA